MLRFHLLKSYILKTRVWCVLLESNCSFLDSVALAAVILHTWEKSALLLRTYTILSFNSSWVWLCDVCIKELFHFFPQESKFGWIFLTFWGHVYMSYWISRIPLSSWHLPLSWCRWSMKTIAKNSIWCRERGQLCTNSIQSSY